MAKAPVRVLVTGTAGYAHVPMIARGIMLGPDQPIIVLHMLDIEPAAEALKGVKMELIDAAFPLLKGVATMEVVAACKSVNIEVMVGGFPCKEGMMRKDVLPKNVPIYRDDEKRLCCPKMFLFTGLML